LTTTTNDQPCACRITTREVAEALGWAEDALVGRLVALGFEVGPDWAGRSSLAVGDADSAVHAVREGLRTPQQGGQQ
jgi:hypothetical protein